MTNVKEIIEQNIDGNTLMIFSKSYCPYCKRAKAAADKLGQAYRAIELDEVDDGAEIQDELEKKTGQRSVPNIFIKGTHVGGCDDFLSKIDNGTVQKLLA
ncbi:glutaredoxin 1 [Conidiobolus coronatus NRRL 28638]|uniref:Glutaredoxin 1 n=1 Tax=Conidiobolus coronatus (strain ATCC 28846 / CBS 209.66 / NRRL 28638) TaxID=796925 RepID=A0A137PF04_CONC2|nr:glutaredoxin 1 [Conidiobolus coronatus NRRL 28638]|eukprot:KXN73589.1 glutaredoxin 1 [Conidiobolus coronatus NRRL 28638]